MGIFEDAWHSGTHLVHNIEHSVVGTVKNAAIALDHAVLEPVADAVVVPLYTKAVKPTAEFVGRKVGAFGKKGLDYAEATVDIAVNTQQSIGQIAKNAGTLGTQVEQGFGSASLGLGSFLQDGVSWWLVGGSVVLVALVVLRR
jgi:hypothetical protein